MQVTVPFPLLHVVTRAGRLRARLVPSQKIICPTDLWGSTHPKMTSSKAEKHTAFCLGNTTLTLAKQLDSNHIRVLAGVTQATLTPSSSDVLG